MQVYRQALLFGYSLQQGSERYSLEMALASEGGPTCDTSDASDASDTLSQYLRRTMTTNWFHNGQRREGEAAEGLLPVGNLVVELRTERDECTRLLHPTPRIYDA